MRFAYADPPYPGQAKRWYGNHRDYAGEVDHAKLIGRLAAEYPDGWALSTSAVALREVLILCPPDVQVAVWHVTSAEPPGGKADHWHRTWEPVIVQGGRRDAPVIRNLLACGALTGCSNQEKHSVPGQKPSAFSRWMFGLLGAAPGDELADLFPGSGAVGREWDAYVAQPWLPALSKPSGNEEAGRRERRWRRAGVPTLMDAAENA